MYKIPKEISQFSGMFKKFKLKLEKHQTDPSICLYLHSKKRVQVLQNHLRHSTVGTHVPDQCLSSMQVNSIGGLTQGQFWNLLLHATLLSRPRFALVLLVLVTLRLVQTVDLEVAARA